MNKKIVWGEPRMTIAKHELNKQHRVKDSKLVLVDYDLIHKYANELRQLAKKLQELKD
jgi:hypothetical protein